MKKLLIILSAVFVYLAFDSNTADPSSIKVVYAAGSGILSLSPGAQSVANGEILSTTVLVDTGGENVDRVLAQITYPTNLLTPQSLEFTNSFINFWSQQDITTPGRITLEGGVSGSGINGSQLTLAKINFETNATGSAGLTFTSDSGIFRDTDAQNILTEARSATYTITDPSASPSPSVSPTATPTLTPIPSGSVTPTPGPGTPTVPPGTTPGVSPGTTPGTGTPTPSVLPNGGAVSPTILFFAVAALLSVIGIYILKKT